MANQNYHKKALEILAENQSINWRDLCFKVALSNPAAFVKAFQSDGPGTHERYRLLVESSGKIVAIKAYRSEFKASLKDAKDAIDRICSGASNA